MEVSTSVRTRGIDVSHFQDEIDWQQVHRAGIMFAFIKATEGLNFIDPLFHQNWRSSKAAGILRGAYHFFRPQLDAGKQALSFLDKLKLDCGDLPPALDIEVLGGVPAQYVVSGARKWLDIVRGELGCNPILYTGSAFWRNAICNSPNLAEFPLWIAHYTAAPQPRVPSAWPQWTFWQFSQQGRIAGICGKVDLNVFNGNLADLQAFCMPRIPELHACSRSAPEWRIWDHNSHVQKFLLTKRNAGRLKQTDERKSLRVVMKLKRRNAILNPTNDKVTRKKSTPVSTRIRRKCVNLALTTRTMGDTVVVHCGGSLIFQKEAAEVCDVISDLVGRYRSVVIDLSEVSVIDGGGLGTLAECIRKAKETGAHLVLCRVPRKVRTLLDLTRISSLVEIADSEGDALVRTGAAA